MAEKKEKEVEKKTFDTTGVLPELPPGYVWCYNRLGRRFEHPYNAAPIVFEPYEVKFLEINMAKFLRKHSVLKEDPNRPKATIRAIVLEDDKEFRKPLPKDYDRGVEILDRTASLGFTGHATPVGTKVEVVKVD
jgi:hypothetical protein